MVTLPIEEEYYVKGKSDVSMWEQLELVAQTQHYWADNQVSVTVTFTKEEAAEIPRALELYESRLKTVSFLPLSDHGYTQAPYIEITEEEYKEMSAHLLPVKIKKNQANEVGNLYCDGDACELPLPIK